MRTKTYDELKLQNTELKKENLRLQKRIAQLEVQVITANNKARATKAPEIGPELMEAIERIYGTPNPTTEPPKLALPAKQPSCPTTTPP